MSTTEETKTPRIKTKKVMKKPKSSISRLASPKTLMGKKSTNKISKDPMDLILALSGKKAHDSNFEGKNMKGADYEGYDLTGSNFNGADLSGSSFKRCILNGCTFKNAKMNGIILDYSIMGDCNLSNADLTGARMRHIKMFENNLRGTIFNGADMSYSDLISSILCDTSFRGAIMKGVKSKKLSVIKKKNNPTQVTSFENADLTCAEIIFFSPKEENVLIGGATLTGSKLAGFKVVGELLENMDLGKSHINNVYFEKVVFNNVIFTRTYFGDTRFKKCIINNSNFDDIESDKISFTGKCKINKCSFNDAKGEISFHNVIITDSIINPSTDYLILNFNDKMASLTNCSFSDGAIVITNLGTDSTLEKCTFHNDILIMDLERGSISNCSFHNTNLDGGKIEHSTISNTDFIKSHFGPISHNNTFVDVLFDTVVFSHTNLLENTFQNSAFKDVKISSTNFGGNKYVNSTIENFKVKSNSKIEPSDAEFFGINMLEMKKEKGKIVGHALEGSPISESYDEESSPENDEKEYSSGDDTNSESDDEISPPIGVEKHTRSNSPNSESEEEKSPKVTIRTKRSKQSKPDSSSSSPQIKSKRGNSSSS